MTSLSQVLNRALEAYRPRCDEPIKFAHLACLLRWDVLAHMQLESVSKDEAAFAPASFEPLYAHILVKLDAIVLNKTSFDDAPSSPDGYSWAHTAARFASAPHALLPALAAHGVDVRACSKDGESILHALMCNRWATPHAIKRALVWATLKGVSVHAQDALGANAAFMAALHLPSPYKVLKLIDKLWPAALRARDARGWGVADALLANMCSPIEALVFVLTQCGLSLDSTKPAVWSVDLQQVLMLLAQQSLTPAEVQALVQQAQRKEVTGFVAYHNDHAV